MKDWRVIIPAQYDLADKRMFDAAVDLASPFPVYGRLQTSAEGWFIALRLAIALTLEKGKNEP